MDRNTLIGFALIGALIIGFSWLSQPSAEQIAAAQQQEQQAKEQLTHETAAQKQQIAPAVTAVPTELDSAVLATLPEYQKPRPSTIVELFNDKLSVTIDTRGAVPSVVMIKGHNSHKDGYEGVAKPLILFNRGDNYFNLPLKTRGGSVINTAECTFEEVARNDSTVVMRLPITTTSYIDFIYRLRKNDYRLDFSIQGSGLGEAIAMDGAQGLQWCLKLPQQEQSHRFEAQYSSLYYGQRDGQVDDLSTTSEESEDLQESLRWLAFKDKYFSSVLINDLGSFERSQLKIKAESEQSGYIYTMDVTTTFEFSATSLAEFTYFFGPNDYNLLKSYDKDIDDKDQLNLDHLVYLGWSVFRSINQWLIIPIVDFLKDYIGSWGIIILLLTVVIKVLLLPFTYKSQLSQAKMRVLKPQVDEINRKYEGKTDQETLLKKQRETMALYSSVGANPMSGCLPMLLQMPFLIALYMYFPTSIYLRGQSFLWAADLSTYDPVIRWDFDIPIISSLLGNHISLFCLLMTIVNVVYNRYMMSQTPTAGGTSGEATAGLRYMPYIMSVMFFFMFNQNASGLSYYYFISTLITIIQFFAIRATINEEKLLSQMEENKKKPRNKRNGTSFLERLERIQREQLEAQRKAGKR